MILDTLPNCYVPKTDTKFVVDFGDGLILWGVPGAYYAGFHNPLRLTAPNDTPCLGVSVSDKNIKRIRREMAAVREDESVPTPELQRIRNALIARGLRNSVKTTVVAPTQEEKWQDVRLHLSFPGSSFSGRSEVYDSAQYHTEPMCHGLHAATWFVVEWVEAGAPSFPIR